MTASPDVTSRINAMRKKLEKSKAGAAEGMARFSESAADNDITLPSSSLRAMLAKIKLDQANRNAMPLAGIQNHFPQTV